MVIYSGLPLRDLWNICVTAAKLLNGGDPGGRVGVVVQSQFEYYACTSYARFHGCAVSYFPIDAFGPPEPGE